MYMPQATFRAARKCLNDLSTELSVGGAAGPWDLRAATDRRSRDRAIERSEGWPSPTGWLAQREAQSAEENGGMISGGLYMSDIESFALLSST